MYYTLILHFIQKNDFPKKFGLKRTNKESRLTYVLNLYSRKY